MKTKVIITILVVFITSQGFGQIDKHLYNSYWLKGVEKTIYDTKIIKLEGVNNNKGCINVGYQSITHKKGCTEDQTLINLYEQVASGGVVHIYITRPTMFPANTVNFSVIVKDFTDENIIYREHLGSKTPSSINQYWENYTEIFIPCVPTGKTYIYVNDNLRKRNSLYKFVVDL